MKIRKLLILTSLFLSNLIAAKVNNIITITYVGVTNYEIENSSIEKMKNIFLISLLAIFTFSSCSNQSEELTEMSSFLQVNYEFNNRVLNKYKGEYYLMVSEQPRHKIEKLNNLDSKYELLISKIDSANFNKTNNLENITIESKEVLNEIKNFVAHRFDYSIPEFEQPKTNSDELHLKYIKNRLVIAMAYAFEYGLEYWGKSCVFRLAILKVDSITSTKTKNGTKLTLASKYGQTKKDNKIILVNKIEFNGQETKVDYKLKENYSFVDIEFDSLKKGTYQINGILRFYEREGKIDIPFNKKFKVE